LRAQVVIRQYLFGMLQLVNACKPDGHDERIESVAFSLDGCRIVSGAHDNTVRLWDA